MNRRNRDVGGCVGSGRPAACPTASACASRPPPPAALPARPPPRRATTLVSVCAALGCPPSCLRSLVPTAAGSPPAPSCLPCTLRMGSPACLAALASSCPGAGAPSALACCPGLPRAYTIARRLCAVLPRAALCCMRLKGVLMHRSCDPAPLLPCCPPLAPACLCFGSGFQVPAALPPSSVPD